MSIYSEIASTPRPQSEQAREDEVKNNAGGFVFEVGPFTRLRRFLVLGAEGGSYYVGQRELVLENAKCIEECLKLDGKRTVAEIVDVSVGGRAPKVSPAIFALAVACNSAGYNLSDTRKAAFAALPLVCRTGSHLQEFTTCLKRMRSFGAGVRKAYSHWYNDKPTDSLAYQFVKYQQRGGMSHRDILRLKSAKRLSAPLALPGLTHESYHLVSERFPVRVRANTPLSPMLPRNTPRVHGPTYHP